MPQDESRDALTPRLTLLYHLCRVQAPQVALRLEAFRRCLEGMRCRAGEGSSSPMSWEDFLARLHGLDAFVAAACLEGSNEAWELLWLDARLGYEGRRLVDALRSRAARLYPGNLERQERAIHDFWGSLLVAEAPGAAPRLQRYDGLRPLGPWLVTVFANREVSQVRREAGQFRPWPPDAVEPAAPAPADASQPWHEAFCDAARAWLAEQARDEDLLLLGLLWRYRLSQREAARLLRVHEGTVSRKISDLAQRALRFIRQELEQLGWTGEDLHPLIATEMPQVLFDEPRLAPESLARLLQKRGQFPPRELDAPAARP
jgi:DNA-directed RNA polymerase specialized sigma24 family protein